ncbi:MAG: 3-deoxy-7-phosphoheptulonate synthase [Herpetosiphon sp.]|nr:3-deoxy-7-phosphoheptulonate synthase [Herpetosiphon sp.]
MLVVMDAHATSEDVEAVCKVVEDMGFQATTMPGPTRTAIGITGNRGAIAEAARIKLMPGVRDVIRVTAPYKLVSREYREADTIIEVGGVPIGGSAVVVMAGPCSVESREQLNATADAVQAAGAVILRGGAFKPRTSPYSFQGLGEEGLKLLAETRERTGMPIITEVMDTEQVDMVAEYADILQLGARNMQNFALLKRVGRTRRPVMLKRGLSATVKDWLLSAEYIMAEGNPAVILCERGIRTFDDHSRGTFDLSVVPVLRELTHLPIIVDPSHATGRWQSVLPMARAGIAAGADGLMIEVHPNPAEAWSDGEQSLLPERFSELMMQVERIALAVDRPVLHRNAESGK